jgi:hypothetical protein
MTDHNAQPIGENRRRNLALLPLVVLTLTYGAIFFYDPDRVESGSTFFHTAAQVIAVLILAMAIEPRVRTVLGEDIPASRIIGAQLWIYLLLGELAAFVGAAGGFPDLSLELASLTGASLAGGFTAVALAAFFGSD